MRGTARRAGGGARTLRRARTAAGRARAGRAGDIARARRAGRGPERAGVARRRGARWWMVDECARARVARRGRRWREERGEERLTKARRGQGGSPQKRSSRNSDGETRVRCR